MRKTLLLVFVIFPILFVMASCHKSTSLVETIDDSTVETTSDSAQDAGTPTLETFSGIWDILEFLGTSFIHTEEENEDDVIGKKLEIRKDGVYYDSNIIIQTPILDVYSVTWDDVLVAHRTDPKILGMEKDKIYNEIVISDALDKQSDIESFIVINDNQLAYYRYSKYYKLVRSDKPQDTAAE